MAKMGSDPGPWASLFCSSQCDELTQTAFERKKRLLRNPTSTYKINPTSHNSDFWCHVPRQLRNISWNSSEKRGFLLFILFQNVRAFDNLKFYFNIFKFWSRKRKICLIKRVTIIAFLLLKVDRKLCEHQLDCVTL